MEIALVYMVAGLSSRFGGKIKSLTEIGPNHKTFIEYSLNQAIPAGFTKIIFIVSKKTEKFFREKFGKNYKGIPVFYALQEYDENKRDKPWGTCDAVCSGISLIKEPFIVCTGDDMYGKKTFEILTNHLRNKEEDATTVKELIKMLPEKGEVNRGIFEADEGNNITNIKEIIKISRENFSKGGFKENTPTSLGIFALHPKTLKLLKKRLEKFKEQNKGNRTSECYLNIELGELIKKGKIKIKLYFTSEEWFGITNPDDVLIIKKKIEQIN